MELKNKNITVMGLGLHGGGEGLVKYLVENKANIKITDLKSQKELKPTIKKLKKYKNIEYHLEGHNWSDFESADVVFKNPAVPENSKWIKKIKSSGIKLSSEMNLFFEQCKSKNIIGITGTNGKSTTATLINEILKTKFTNTKKQKVFFGGNIGGTLLNQLSKISEDDIVVLELSSFQLQNLANIKKSPHIAVILNLTPDHLDQHKDFQEYKNAKSNIVKFQTKNDSVIINANDQNVAEICQNIKSKIFRFAINSNKKNLDAFVEKNKIFVFNNQEKNHIISKSNIFIPGNHNIENILAAVLVAKRFNVSSEKIKKAIINFKGLEHRVEFVSQLNGVKFYNDSKATTSDSTIAAIKSFSKPVILIAGGKDKNVDLTQLANVISKNVKNLILIGQTASKIENLVKKNQGLKSVNISNTLEKAVIIAKKLSENGDIVLFSPSSSSFDQFENFEQRGKIYKKLIQKR